MNSRTSQMQKVSCNHFSDIKPFNKQTKKAKVDIQTLEHKEIVLLTDLQPPEWQDIVPTFDYYTKAAFCFPIKVTIDNKIVGIGTTIIHNDIAWLAHIIVHPDKRNKGIGQLITQTFS